MRLNEFYTPEDDKGTYRSSTDTRKTRLTLGQISTIRKTAEARELEQAKDLEFVKQMYGQPPADQAGTL